MVISTNTNQFPMISMLKKTSRNLPAKPPLRKEVCIRTYPRLKHFGQAGQAAGAGNVAETTAGEGNHLRLLLLTHPISCTCITCSERNPCWVSVGIPDKVIRQPNHPFHATYSASIPSRHKAVKQETEVGAAHIHCSLPGIMLQSSTLSQ